MSNENEKEFALRAHIRTLLLDYSLTHLTKNYVAYTEEATSKILTDSLKPVPLVDPTDPAMPLTIYESLCSVLPLTTVTPYDESFVTDSSALSLIKSVISTLSKGQSMDYWTNDTDEMLYRLNQPISPVLTLQALRETPKLGTHKIVKVEDHSHLVTEQGIHEAPEEEILDTPSLDLDHALNNRLTLDPETTQSVNALLKTAVGVSAHKGTATENEHVKSFLRSDSPPIELPRFMPTPIFPSRRHVSPAKSPRRALFGQCSAADIPVVIGHEQVQIQDEDMYKDLDECHMVVVDGWHTYQTSSSPTPSLESNVNEDVDELFLETHPPHEDTSYIKTLLNAKMDEHLMPRSEQIGGSSAKLGHVGENKSLGSFLMPIVNIQADNAKIISSPKSQPSSPHTAITASVIALPSITVEDDITLPPYLDCPSSDDLPNVLRDMGMGDEIQDPLAFIFGEKLDEKETNLMDVPQLAPPNEHPPNGIWLPESLSSLIHSNQKSDHDVVSGNGDGDRGSSLPGCLKKAKGLQSLNIELSWRPFNYGTSIPTHDQVAKVDTDIKDEIYPSIELNKENIDAQLAHLLKTAQISDDIAKETSTISASEAYWLDDDTPLDLITIPGAHDAPQARPLVLTAEEMRRLYGRLAPEPIEEQDEDQPTEDSSPPASKRLRLSPQTFNIAETPEMVQPQVHTVIYVRDDYEPDYDTTFGRLSDGAEGFDGPQGDGEAFPDLDPIYMQDEYPSPSNPLPRLQSHLQSPGLNTGSTTGDKGDDSFMPLSFDATQQTAPNVLSVGSNNEYISPKPTRACGDDNPENVPDGPQLSDDHKRSPAKSYVLNAVAGIGFSSAKHSLATFLELRAKATALPHDVAEHGPPSEASELELKQWQMAAEPLDFDIPLELLDRNTLTLPDPFPNNSNPHRYMACMDVLVKRALLRCLSSPCCSVQLVEREYLGGAHLILDPDTAVLLWPLLALPSQGDELLEIIGNVSWSFSQILVIFEGFPSSCYNKLGDESQKAELDPFSPPVLKAVKKLRRDLNLAEEYANKKKGVNVDYAFALTVEEAAKYARTYGTLAESRDTTGGAIWGERGWLDLEEQTGEMDVAGTDGMNAFAASIILSQTTLDGFLDRTAEERMAEFGAFVGVSRMVGLFIPLYLAIR
ncbi:hypothetical protein K474DRAFT_1656939 [Panus rudis PR-1116 ss-1]|nr:hypothetical protein K474DRAFT_1656939 [Panus rudis PR-1116 ss-1]